MKSLTHLAAGAIVTFAMGSCRSPADPSPSGLKDGPHLPASRPIGIGCRVERRHADKRQAMR